MKMNHLQRKSMYLLFWIVWLLALFSSATARQERESPAPSMAPTKKPKNKESDVDDDYEDEQEYINTERPTLTPTSYPTEWPTSTPTSYPTKLPSFVPSQQPTQRPTFSVAPSAIPSMLPSVVPSAQPSFVPTFMPTQVPSDIPSSAPSIVPTATVQPSFYPSCEPSISPTGVLSTPLPWLHLAFRAPTDETTGKAKALEPIDIELLREAVDAFLVQFMTTSVSRKSFESLNANVLMQGDSEFLITGEALFVTRDPPSEGFLKEKMITYFTFWGIRDLRSHLETAGLSVAAEIDVTVAGERVSGIDGGNNNNVDVPSVDSTEKGSSSFENSLVIGIIIAVVALVGAMIFAAYKWRSYASSSAPSNGTNYVAPTGSTPQRQEQPRVIPSKSLPPKESPPEEFMIDDSQSQSGLSGLHSMADDSLFYDADKHRGLPSKFQYDASRLDQVISSAKQSSETNDEF